MTHVLALSRRQQFAYLLLFLGNAVLLTVIGLWSLAKDRPIFGPWQWDRLPGFVIAAYLLPVLFVLDKSLSKDDERELAATWIFFAFAGCVTAAVFLALGAWLFPMIIPWTWAGFFALGTLICLYELFALLLSFPKE